MKSLVIYPQYGLANRLRAVASAKILADYTGRKLLVNWSPSERECNVGWEDLFINQLEGFPLPLSSFINGTNLYDDSGNHDYYWDVPGFVAQNISDVVAMRTFRNFRPREMTEKEFRRLKSVFYKDLRPVSVIREAVENIQEQYFKDNVIVGIHIRRTDYLSYLGQEHTNVAPTGLFTRKMMNILRADPKTRFFLATDDKKDEELIRNIFQDAVIILEKKAISRSTVQSMQDALTDWLLLSRTSNIIGSYRSSFNEEAGIIHMIDVETIPGKALLLNLKAHYELLKKEGLKKVISYSYRYRKEKMAERIRKYLK